MRILILSLLLVSFPALSKERPHEQANSGETNRGRSIMGPTTPLNRPPSPSSGPTNYRSKDITGEGTGSTTHMSSDVNPAVPAEKPKTREPYGRQAQEDEELKIQEGPYEDGKYKFDETEE